MDLDAFLEGTLKLKFSKLSSNLHEKNKQKEIYKRFSNETDWSCIKDIDKENLELLNDVYKALYSKCKHGVSMRLVPENVSKISALLEIPNPRFEVYLTYDHNTEPKYVQKNEKSIELVRRGRIIILVFKQISTKEEKFYDTSTKLDLTRSNVEDYLYKVTLHQNVSKILGLNYLKKVKGYLKKSNKITKLIKRLILILWPLIMISPLNKISRKLRFRQLSKSDFLSLKILDKNPLNDLVRKPHFDRATYNGKAKTTGELVELLDSFKNLPEILIGSHEPKLVEIDEIPMHLNLSFWNNGDRYFINCVLSGFKENVLPYESLKKIQLARKPMYSMEYYENLDAMTDRQIEILLKNSPICIRDKAIASGRHKMFAMVGRIAIGKKYIPFYVDRLI